MWVGVGACVRTQPCTISGREVALATKFGAVGPTILRWLLDFGNIYASLYLCIFFFAYDSQRLSLKRRRCALGPLKDRLVYT